jgi:glutathione S-transferase
VTEVAAICCYLADAFPEAGLAPPPSRPRRLLPLDLLHLGPDRGGVQQQGRGLGADARAQRMFGYGNYDLASTRSRRRSTGGIYRGDHFTAADLFVGANVNFMLASSTCSSRAGVRRLCRANDRPRRLSPRQGEDRRQADRRDAGRGLGNDMDDASASRRSRSTTASPTKAWTGAISCAEMARLAGSARRPSC